MAIDYTESSEIEESVTRDDENDPA